MNINKSILVIGALLGVSLAANASNSTVSQYVTNQVAKTETYFNFNKFNTSLGTLNGITLTLVSSADYGSFTVENQTGISGFVQDPTDYLKVYNSQAGNAKIYQSSIASITTTPDTSSDNGNGATLAGNSTVGFTISSNSIIGGSPISLGSLSPLSSYEGSGFVSFGAKVVPNVTVTANTFNVDSTDWLNTSVLEVTYDYTSVAVPEPGKFLFLGLGIAALALVAARMYSRKEGTLAA
jgi:hypothetical protein